MTDASDNNVLWVQIGARSWHAVAGGEVTGDGSQSHTTYCGRESNSTPTEHLPDGKSCESCLRILAKLSDRSTRP